MALIPTAIPSPPQGVWHIGPVPIRAYAIFILIGIVLCIYFGNKRYQARGGNKDVIYDIALIAVPLGIIGGRFYHVAITAGPQYFGENADPWEIFRIWDGGLGIWGAVLFGIVGMWIAARRARIRLAPFLDSLAPMVLYAQALGRLGNWFNQELFGRPTTLPWGLRIDNAHLPPGYPPGTLFHPTFLYELIWNVIFASIILIIDKKLTLYAGQVSALYFITYSVGRTITEQLRIDPSEYLFGLRIHIWVCLLGFIIGVALFIYCQKVKWPRNLSKEEYEQTRISGEDTHQKKKSQKRKALHSSVKKDTRDGGEASYSSDPQPEENVLKEDDGKSSFSTISFSSPDQMTDAFEEQTKNDI